MNRKVGVFLLVCAVCVLAGVAEAATKNGSAIIPNWRAWNYDSLDNITSHIMISNITDSDVDVTITLYDKSGAVFTDSSNGSTSGKVQYLSAWTNGTISPWTETTTDTSVEFTLGGRDTIRIYIPGNTATADTGYGIISWEQSSSDAVHALVAQGFVFEFKTESSRNRGSEYSVQINNGMPF